MADTSKQISTSGVVSAPSRRRKASRAAPDVVRAHEVDRRTLRGLPLSHLLETTLTTGGDAVLSDLALDELEERLGWDQAARSLYEAGPAGVELAQRRWGGWISSEAPATSSPEQRPGALPQAQPSVPWMTADAASRPLVMQLKRKAPAREISALKAAPRSSGAHLPEALRRALERRSGIDLSDVRVHLGSEVPAELGAHAAAVGPEIFVAPGQEEHLAHEAWHVVQQRQGRVQPTSDVIGDTPVNADPALEREADAVGHEMEIERPAPLAALPLSRGAPASEAVAQLKVMLGPSRESKQSFEAYLRGRKVRSPDFVLEASIKEKVIGWIQDGTTRDFKDWDAVLEAARVPDGVAQPQVQAQAPEPAPQQQVDAAEDDAGEDEAAVGGVLQVEQVEQAIQQVQVAAPAPDQQAQAQVPAAPQPAPDLGVAEEAPELVLKQEGRTRVGFEIEVGGHVAFPPQLKEALVTLVNKTLLVFTVKGGGAVLEMLLDDIKDPGRGQPNCLAQVEFRTRPLLYSQINPALGAALKAAISGLPAKFWQGGALSAGTWAPTDTCTAALATLRQGAGNRMRAPGKLAQHATTSIEMAAFAKLDPADQAVLYPGGSGARSKQALLGKMANLGNGQVDATTGGRNSALIMPKAPVESLLAADQSLAAPASNATSVKVADKDEDTFDFGGMEEVAQQIRDKGEFPSIQGEDGLGYRAVAEKLQPPLQDAVSGELRVLVEHRGGELRDAINDALAGKPERLAKIAAVAARMDDKRVPKE